MSERTKQGKQRESKAKFIAYKLVNGRKQTVFITVGAYRLKETIKELINSTYEDAINGVDVVLTANYL